MASADKQFLDDNAKKEGVITTKSGLQYKVLTEGTGAKPKSANSEVEVHYEGSLINGSVFDSSYKRGEPIDFPLTGVIKCWTEGVAMMKVGGKSKLVCPSKIAYGSAGHPPVIPRDATLIFEVELLDSK